MPKEYERVMREWELAVRLGEKIEASAKALLDAVLYAADGTYESNVAIEWAKTRFNKATAILAHLRYRMGQASRVKASED